MIYRVIMGIVGQMEKEHLIMPQEKDDYIYAYEVICEKVISLGTIVILGMLLDNLVNTVLYMLFFLTLRKYFIILLHLIYFLFIRILYMQRFYLC